jgi:N,N'-diacetyllegionaminate synthase
MKMNHKKIQIGEKTVGPGHPVYIVFEAGPTHDGIRTAKKLVDVAAEAGADAIKFQILDAKKIVSSRDVVFSYTRLVDKETGQTEQVNEPLLDILQRREMAFKEWEELIRYCQKKGIEFFSTASNIKELEFMNTQKVQMVKICSGDLNYHYFLRQAASYDWIVQIDTGSSSIGEVEAAVDVLESCACDRIIINHCPSGYPAWLGGINLRVITTLLQMFPCPVAFSDHSTGHDMDIAAVVLGANMIEKTITTDRTIRSPEHIMSLEPDEAADFVQTIRDLEVALGNKRRVVSQEEKDKRLVSRRSLFSARDLKKGEKLSQDMLAYSRPGNGIPADMDVYVLGRYLLMILNKLRQHR